MLEHVLHLGLIADHGHVSFVQGLPASPGAATGAVVFDADEAAELGTRQSVILVTTETSPEDIHGMAVAQGILTARGGMTSHAAVVARGMGKPAIVGAERIQIDLQARTLTVGATAIRHLEMITLDGASGQVFAGEIPTVLPETGPKFYELLGWADRVKRLGVRASRHASRRATRPRVRGAGHRTVPNRTHVLRRGSPAVRAGNDPHRIKTRGIPDARTASRDAMSGLPRDPAQHGWIAGDHRIARCVIRMLRFSGIGRSEYDSILGG
jgi:phosphohistidine swiveling domain-containing protein